MQIPSILPLFFFPQSPVHGNAKSFKSDLTSLELNSVFFLVGNYGHYSLREFVNEGFSFFFWYWGWNPGPGAC